MYTNIRLKEIYLIFLLLKRKISKENENTANAIRDRQKQEVECEQKKSNAKYFNVQFITFAFQVSQLRTMTDCLSSARIMDKCQGEKMFKQMLQTQMFEDWE